MKLFFSVIPYALYSVTNYIEKFLIEKEIPEASTLTIISGSFSIFIALGIFILKGLPLISLPQTFLLLFIGTLLTFYYIPYFKALSLDDTSRVVPLFQFFPIFVLIMSSLFLHEVLTEKQFFGFFIVLIGGFLLGTEKLSVRIFTLRKSFWLMILSSFLYALTGILFKFVTISDFWVSMTYQTFGMALGALLFLYPPYQKMLFRDLKKIRRRLITSLAISQLITIAADFAYFYAITLTSVTFVSVMQGTQPFFLLLFGVILTLFFPNIIREDIDKKTLGKKILSIMLLAIGVAIIYL